jgi:hypothetical protein
LRILADELRAERSVLAGHVVDPRDSLPALGVLAASGSRTASAPGEYAVVVEAVREGYLLHHREPRLLADADADLALLAGDYLYALGIDRLAAIGDLEAVSELSDLISLAAQIHAQDRGAELADALWLGSVTAIACGASGAHEEAKRALLDGRDDALEALVRSTRRAAGEGGIDEHLSAAAEAIDFGAASG